MARLAQICLLYVCLTFVNGFFNFGNNRPPVYHDLSEVPELISNIFAQQLGHGPPPPPPKHHYGSNRPQPFGVENGFIGPRNLDFNYGKPNIFGGNLFRPQEYTGQGSNSEPQKSGEPLFQNPDNYGNTGFNVAMNSPNEPDTGFNGPDILRNINIPQVPNFNSDKVEKIAAGGIKDNTFSNTQIPINNQIGEIGAANPTEEKVQHLPINEGVITNVEGNNHINDISLDKTIPAAHKLPSESNLQGNVPSGLSDQVSHIGSEKTDSQNKKQNVNDQISLSGESEKHLNEVPRDGPVGPTVMSNSENIVDKNIKSIINEHNDENSKLKTNQLKSPNHDSDISLSKYKAKSAIVFPDGLAEAKIQMNKEHVKVNNKDVSQLSKMNDMNGAGTGQILYAVNVGPALVPSYVSPSSISNGHPAQYILQNPSSNNAPSSSNILSNSNTASPSGGYTYVNVPVNGNSNYGPASYNVPSYSGQGNAYYQVPCNQGQQAYYTVQLSNGQIALVPVNTPQYIPNNGQVLFSNNGQQYVMSNGQPTSGSAQAVLPNGQQYVSGSQPLANNGQIVMSNDQQYVPNSQPIQYIQVAAQPIQGQVTLPANGQQYVMSNGQPTPGSAQAVLPNVQQYVSGSQPLANNGQIVVSKDRQYAPNNQPIQYVQVAAQPIQGQVTLPANGQQYVQSNSKPGQVIVSNGQIYVPNGQESTLWNGQSIVPNTGQNLVPASNPVQIQNPQANVVAVPAGSFVAVDGNGGAVPLVVFKDKDESSKDSSANAKPHDNLEQQKDIEEDKVKEPKDKKIEE